MVTHDIAESILLSDRVIVLTNRPSEVSAIFKIDFNGLNGSFSKRNSPEFLKYYNLIGKELNEYE